MPSALPYLKNLPMKYTPERVDKLIEFIKQGTPITYACAACDISYNTYKNWKSEFQEFQSCC